ncbi:MAG: histidinol-phosphatase HisJ family protein [Firmicutes bacterium]|nr:histidinol-phosphatase HisJ family protein [Bacillota bacterium]
MFYDYHTHSSYSDDSDTPLKEMLDQAVKLGVAEIAVTDHFDPGYPDRDYPFELKFDKYHTALESAQAEYEGKLRIVKGIEIGIMDDQLDRCRAAAKSYDYDYIIGSFHCALQEPLYNGHFFDGKSPKQAYIDYFTCVYDNLKVYKDYCNLGHMNIVARYCEGAPDFKDYSDICEAILKMIIEDGKGIELNTSSFRYNMSCTCPSEEILRLYLSLGGEILTMGSDAHTPDKIADHFEFAAEYLRSLGFKYLTTFKGRKPSFEVL